MRARGKYGIPRDPDGSLANLMAWPWYWRNPLAILGACIGFFVFALASTHAHYSLAVQLIAGVVVLLSAVLGYELTGLCLLGALIYWLSGSARAQGLPWWSSIAIGCAVAAFLYFRDAIRELHSQASRAAEDADATKEKVAALELEVFHLRRELRRYHEG